MHFYEENGKDCVHDHELVIGAYLHKIMDSDELQWSFESIQVARNLPPNQLKRFIESFEYIFPPKVLVSSFTPERWYKFTIQFSDYEPHDFEVVSHLDVTNSDNPFDRIH
jgi:hypothetical protein